MRVPRPPAKPGAGAPSADEDAAARSASASAAVLRKKGGGVRAWLVLDAAGQAQVVEAGKHAIMRRTGLPARDLRILDPLLSYPSTVLGRERAVVINLEHIKAIITAQEVLLLNARDPPVAPFVDELQRRLLRFHKATAHSDQEGALSNGEANWAQQYDDDDYSQSRNMSPHQYSQTLSESENLVNLQQVTEKEQQDDKPNIRNGVGPRVLPFEFIALEACLEAACSCLDNEARTLEQEAHPALDKLTSKISTLNLERVRQIKSRLVAITGRVQKVWRLCSWAVLVLLLVITEAKEGFMKLGGFEEGNKAYLVGHGVGFFSQTQNGWLQAGEPLLEDGGRGRERERLGLV